MGCDPTKRVSTPKPSSASRTYPPNSSSPTAVTTALRVPEACGRDGDVGRAAADRLRERLYLGQRHAELLGVEVDADPPDRQQLRARLMRCTTPLELVGERFELGTSRHLPDELLAGDLALRVVADHAAAVEQHEVVTDRVGVVRVVRDEDNAHARARPLARCSGGRLPPA